MSPHRSQANHHLLIRGPLPGLAGETIVITVVVVDDHPVVRAGMRTLLLDGKIKILRGETTPEEVARFAQAESLTAAEFVDV